MKNINVAMRETLALALPDEWLFGKSLDEKIKTAKSLEICGRKLKPLRHNQSLSKGSKNLKG